MSFLKKTVIGRETAWHLSQCLETNVSRHSRHLSRDICLETCETNVSNVSIVWANVSNVSIVSNVSNVPNVSIVSNVSICPTLSKLLYNSSCVLFSFSLSFFFSTLFSILNHSQELVLFYSCMSEISVLFYQMYVQKLDVCGVHSQIRTWLSY